MSDLEPGDRVKVIQLIKEEPCSDIDVLLGHTGTVLNPTVPDEDYDGNPIMVALIKFDEPAIEPVTGEASWQFVFRHNELEKI